jgi:type VI secretion system secreted protein Hcp
MRNREKKSTMAENSSTTGTDVTKPRARPRLRRLLAGAAAVAALVPAPVPAAASMFLKIPNVPGDSDNSKFDHAIYIRSFQDGFVLSTAVGRAGSGLAVGKPQCGPIVLEKDLDKSSLVLMNLMMQGSLIAKMDLYFEAAVFTTEPYTYYQITAENVYLNEYSHTSSGERLKENVSFVFSKITHRYTPQNLDGSLGTQVEFLYDCAKSKTQ